MAERTSEFPRPMQHVAHARHRGLIGKAAGFDCCRHGIAHRRHSGRRARPAVRRNGYVAPEIVKGRLTSVAVPRSTHSLTGRASKARWALQPLMCCQWARDQANRSGTAALSDHTERNVGAAVQGLLAAYVMPTDEELMTARHTASLLSSGVAVSNGREYASEIRQHRRCCALRRRHSTRYGRA